MSRDRLVLRSAWAHLTRDMFAMRSWRLSTAARPCSGSSTSSSWRRRALPRLHLPDCWPEVLGRALGNDRLARGAADPLVVADHDRRLHGRDRLLRLQRADPKKAPVTLRATTGCATLTRRRRPSSSTRSATTAVRQCSASLAASSTSCSASTRCILRAAWTELPRRPFSKHLRAMKAARKAAEGSCRKHVRVVYKESLCAVFCGDCCRSR